MQWRLEEMKEKQTLLLWLVSLCFLASKMTIDVPPSGAQSVRTNRPSFSSSNGIEATPVHNYASVSNGDGYDSDGSNFAPLWVLSFLLDIDRSLFKQVFTIYCLITPGLVDKSILWFGRLMLADIKFWIARGRQNFLITEANFTYEPVHYFYSISFFISAKVDLTLHLKLYLLYL